MLRGSMPPDGTGAEGSEGSPGRPMDGRPMEGSDMEGSDGPPPAPCLLRFRCSGIGLMLVLA